jgi:hypothetical protein
VARISGEVRHSSSAAVPGGRTGLVPELDVLQQIELATVRALRDHVDPRWQHRALAGHDPAQRISIGGAGRVLAQKRGQYPGDRGMRAREIDARTVGVEGRELEHAELEGARTDDHAGAAWT